MLHAGEKLENIAQRRRLRGRGQAPPLHVVVAALVLSLAGVLAPSTSAKSATLAASKLTMHVSAGFNTRYRSGNWVPLYVTLYNNGADFSGMLAASSPPSLIAQASFTIVPISSYRVPVTLPHGMQKQFTLYLPAHTFYSVSLISVQLQDDHGKVIQSQPATLHSLGPQDVFVGLLTEQAAGFAPLQAFALPDPSASVVVQFLNAQTMPSMAAVLANFNVIILDTFRAASLTREQLMVLQTWVNQGGALIEIGGSQWQQTLGPLPVGLLPVRVHGTGILPAGTRLLPVGGPIVESSGQAAARDTVQAPITVSKAAAEAGAQVILSAGSTPLLVQAHRGQGSICYLAFDPTLEPIVGWPGITALWKELLFRSLGDQLLPSNSDPASSTPYSLAALQHLFFPTIAPSPLLLLSLFLCYLIALGPVRWLTVRRLKQRIWSGRIVLGTIVIFSLLNYGTALYQQGTSILSSSLSIIQLSPGAAFAHSTSYINVYEPFVSVNGALQVQFPGGTLVQPFANTSQQPQAAIITANADETEVSLPGASLAMLNALQVEQDLPIHGGIISHLALKQGTLAGTVTNTLTTGLSDVYLLTPYSFVRIDTLGPGQTSNIKLALPVSASSAGTPSCASLAKQVAATASGAITRFDQLLARDTPQSLNDKQRRASLLAFLMTSLQCSHSPLAAGSFATLVGWADHPLDTANNLTFNGIHPGGLHETLLLAPLTMTYAAGSLTLAGDVLPGRLVDAEAVSIRPLSALSYMVEMGQLTFEYSVPASSQLHVQAMTLTQPVDSSTSPYLAPGGSANKTTYLSLYNWQTGSWNRIKLTPSTPFITQNTKAYLGPGGRILLQWVNHASELAPAAFTKPGLTVNGTITSQ